MTHSLSLVYVNLYSLTEPHGCAMIYSETALQRVPVLPNIPTTRFGWMRTSRQARWTSLTMHRVPDSTDCFRRRQLSSRVAKRTLPSDRDEKYKQQQAENINIINHSLPISPSWNKQQRFRFTQGHCLGKVCYCKEVIYISYCGGGIHQRQLRHIIRIKAINSIIKWWVFQKFKWWLKSEKNKKKLNNNNK